MKKFLHFDWLRAVQFLGKYSAKKRNSVFQKLQIALVLRTRAISIVFKKLTRRACFFQIALETILLLILIKTFCDEKLQNKFCITKNIHICLFTLMFLLICSLVQG